MTYLLDANVFIQAKNAHYAFDIVPGFWQWLEQSNAAGTLYTPEKVAAEVRQGNDDLAAWVKARESSLSVAARPEDATSLQAVSSWVVASPVYTQAAVSSFLSCADYYLVAQAHSHGFIVVTHETPSPLSTKRVKIPDACGALGVNWMSPFEMLRIEQAVFRL